MLALTFCVRALDNKMSLHLHLHSNVLGVFFIFFQKIFYPNRLTNKEHHKQSSLNGWNQRYRVGMSHIWLQARIRVRPDFLIGMLFQDKQRMSVQEYVLLGFITSCVGSLVVSMWYSHCLSGLLLRSACGQLIRGAKLLKDLALEPNAEKIAAARIILCPYFTSIIIKPSLSTLSALSLTVHWRKCAYECERVSSWLWICSFSTHTFAKLHKGPVNRQSC